MRNVEIFKKIGTGALALSLVGCANRSGREPMLVGDSMAGGNKALVAQDSVRVERGQGLCSEIPNAEFVSFDMVVPNDAEAVEKVLRAVVAEDESVESLVVSAFDGSKPHVAATSADVRVGKHDDADYEDRALGVCVINNENQ